MCVHVCVCASLYHSVLVRVSGCVNRRGGAGGGLQGDCWEGGGGSRVGRHKEGSGGGHSILAEVIHPLC